MKARDKEVLAALEKFRVLDRDQLVRMFFRQHKSPVSGANTLLKRLKLQGKLDVDTTARPYRYFPLRYFPLGSKMKRDSAKLPHHKAITDFYLDVCEYAVPIVFEIEKKVATGVIPDVFMIWNGAPFFIELQIRRNWSSKEVRQKFDDYGDYYVSREWKELPWQPESAPVFPYVLVISDKPCDLNKIERGLNILQATNFHNFITTYIQQ